jgi:hypothetical protein
MKYYMEFGNRYIEVLAKYASTGEQEFKSFFDHLPHIEKWKEEPMLSVYGMFRASHLFEISETTKKLLMLTKIPHKGFDEPMPFDYMFLDVKFTLHELKNIGIPEITATIGKNNETESFDNIEGILVAKIGLDNEKKEVVFSILPGMGTSQFTTDSFVVPIGGEESAFQEYSPKEKHQKFIRDFTINILHLINDPHVKIVKLQHDDERNEKRLKKNKLPIPTRHIIKLTGELKEYENRLAAMGHIWRYNYSFWVRGHWKHFRSERYVYKKGMKTWTPPYIKGDGMLVQKKYDVDKK